jgi:catechol 2,3-dioxygenase-like lactoylglutathione lyase family enzyme
MSVPRQVSRSMTHSGLHITQIATVVVPVTDQDEALAFYVGALGMRKVSDFTYESGDDSGEHLVVAARAGVAKEHAVELERQRQLTERARPLVADLGGP